MTTIVSNAGMDDAPDDDLRGMTTREQLAAYASIVWEPTDLIEVRAAKIDDKGDVIHVVKRWYTAADLPNHVDELAKLNAEQRHIWAGICPRRSAGGSKAEDALFSRALCADMDNISIGDTRHKWDAAGLPPPSAMIRTGHGVQSYLALKNPVDPEAFTGFQKDLAILLGCDKKIRDAARMLRLPGFRNVKPPPADAFLVEYDARLKYDLADLHHLIPHVEAPTPSKIITRPFNPPDGVPVNADEVEVRAVAYLDAMPPAISGEDGHGSTYKAAVAMVHGFCLPKTVALRLLLERYNPRCKPPWSTAELQHKVNDAEDKPHDKPRGWLRDADDQSDLRRTAKFNTDIGNAARFTLQHRDDLRFCHATARWYRFTGRRWEQDNSGEVMRRAKKTALAIYKELKECPDDKREALAEHWVRSHKRDRLSAMIELAKPELSIGVDDFDADDYLLNCRNGTIDLRTGELREHRREDLITKMAPVDYSPDAECPRWQAFLSQVFNDDLDLIEFVHRLTGHCLTGDVKEQLFPVGHGKGANGKSVFVDTVCGMMGDYAGQAAPELLTVTKQREHPTEIADLMGKRFVVVSETEDGAKLRLQLMKRLTGDASLKARFMYGNYFEFRRTHKLLLITNNKPRVQEDTEAAWRRIKLIPFTVTIPPADRDPRLLDKLRSEWPGILRRAVEGCLTWQREGLNMPKAVLMATAAYRQESDDAAEFLSECCTTAAAADGSPAWIGSAALREAVEAWAKERGEKPIPSKQLYAKMREQGAEPETNGGKRGWTRFRLLNASK